jgi:ribosome-binding protein aMBF1 (putative translation factor)
VHACGNNRLARHGVATLKLEPRSERFRTKFFPPHADLIFMKTEKTAPHEAARQVGRYIRSRRLALGLSRADLARRLNLVLGSHISHVERGEGHIASEAMVLWAHALEIDTATFIQQMDYFYSAEAGHTLTVERAQPHSVAQVTLA